MNRWHKLGDYIVDHFKGITPKYAEDSQTIVLNQKCIRANSINFDLARFHSDEKSYNPKKVLKVGDLLFNSTGQGTAGRCAFVKSLPKDKRVITDSHILILRLSNQIIAECFSYLFYSKESFFQTFMDGSTGQGELDKLRLFNVEFRVPEIDKARHICRFFNDLDAKIELNNQINEELEAMAKLVYDYWFVQFDFPYKNGKPYKSSGGKMVYNEVLKREIPDGWQAGSLLDIATYTNGIACQKYRPTSSEFLPVIKIKDMREGLTSRSEKVKLEIPEKVKVYDGDILFSWSASLEVMQWAGGNGALNQHIFKVTSDKYPKSYYFFELLNYLHHFKMIAELRKTTMGHITREHLKQSQIVIAPFEIITQLDKILSPILSKQITLKKENQELASLRDWLLPMLMNGQVSVGEGYTIVEKKLGMAAEGDGKYGEG